MSCALALHSCSPALGLALLDGGQSRSMAHPLGRQLANGLLEAVEELLPAARWPQLQWLAVAPAAGSRSRISDRRKSNNPPFPMR